jgi:LysM repeat protein
MVARSVNARPKQWRRLLALALVLCMTAPAIFASGEGVYTVKSGDTLYGIARRNGISLAALAERNGRTKNGHVYVGERLTIPVNSSIAALPLSIQRSILEADVTPGRWKRIIVHHSGVDCGTVEAMDRYHREQRHMENGLAYHFVIGGGRDMEEGRVEVGRRWKEQLDGGHVASEALNRVSIGICLVGNFEKHKPTRKQMRQLTALVKALLKRCRIAPSAVQTHRQAHVNHTCCPGKYFPTNSWLKDLCSASRSRP